jgi:lipopolysaccharide/colanic/teichoic acid biosynthesis glycosyltransferase
MWLGKRAFDFFFSLVALIVLSPLLIFISMLIKLESPGPVFFRQERVGLCQKIFRIHKFRSMIQNAEKIGLGLTVGNDSRVTRCGSFLRKYKLDELPQFLDVLLGHMSVVGPRPELPKYVEKYPIEKRDKIFLMKPGMTDLASLKFKDENKLLDLSSDPEKTYICVILPIKISYYEEYSKHSNLFLDLKIIFSTISEIFLRRNVHELS